MTLRSFLFWPHLCAGVLAGAIVLVMSVTGVLLTYERQMIAWSDRHLRSQPPTADAVRLPLDALLARVRAVQPELTPSTITIGSAADAPVLVAAGQRTFYVDAYTGRLLGEGSQGVRRFMSELRGWHRWLAVDGDGRLFARSITGWSNLLFLFIIASGAYLWLPRRWSWRHVRPVVFFRGGLAGKARDFNWHNVLGVWSAIPLFVIVLAAVPISFPWANALLFRVVGEQPPAGRGGGPGPQTRGSAPGGAARDAMGSLATAAPTSMLDDIMRRAAEQSPGWRTMSVRVDSSGQQPLTVNVDHGDGGQPQLRSTMTFDARHGTGVTRETFSDQSLGRRLRSVARFAHTGEILGIPGQTVAGIATAASVVLVWTGIALTLRRFAAWLSRLRTRSTRADERQSNAA